MENELQDSPNRPVKAVSLLSGGLDSILATRVVQDQGVEVLALQFISPFFGYEKKGREKEVGSFYREKYGIRVRIVDVSEEYLGMLAKPQYGYGKNFNPCVDCKIFLVRKALEIMHAEEASFLITGEVLGQRPMSQRRDTLNAIARDTGTRGILLRPLSARLLLPTAPEERGWVDRSRLHGFSGRGRHDQMALAASLGITEYPTPAGGCRLTDPCLGARVRRYYETTSAAARNAEDIRLLLTGRPYRFPAGSLLSLGRGEGENATVAQLAQAGDERVFARDVPGPLGLFRPRGEGDERPLAAAVLLRYCPKAAPGTPVAFEPVSGAPAREVVVERATDDLISLGAWRL